MFFRLRDEPAAPGEWRGGIGIIRVNRFLEETIVTCEGDRHESDPPWGIFGGHEGLNGAIFKNFGTAAEESWPSKVTGRSIAAGDTIAIVVPSGGGYGDPLDRDPALVVGDILDGFATREQAERDYGVVLDPATLVVGAAATARLRGTRLSARRVQAERCPDPTARVRVLPWLLTGAPDRPWLRASTLMSSSCTRSAEPAISRYGVLSFERPCVSSEPGSTVSRGRCSSPGLARPLPGRVPARPPAAAGLHPAGALRARDAWTGHRPAPHDPSAS